MADESFIGRLTTADADEFARMLANPSRAEERELVEHLGEDRFQRLQRTILRGGQRGTRAGARGNVIVLPGIMGSELCVVDGTSFGPRIWLHAARLVVGAAAGLWLAADGASPYQGKPPVGASGILKRPYGELLVSLAADWNVRAFSFDWRKALATSADALRDRIVAEFGATAPVHLVAHSMGGLVARTFVAKHAEQWKAMWDAEGGGQRGGRLVMLGTPNGGSWAIPQVITGLEGLVRKLGLIDVVHSKRDVLRILNSFLGTVQMLPSPIGRPEREALYQAATWGDLDIPQAHLDAALVHHRLLASDAAIDERMVYVAGANVPTLDGVDASHVRDKDRYRATLAGDGRVTHELGRLVRSNDYEVQRYFVEASHGGLTEAPPVLDALNELMETGRTKRLAGEAPAKRGPADPAALREEIERQTSEELARLEDLVDATAGGAEARGSRRFGGDQERQIEDELVRGVLATEGDAPAPPKPPFPPAKISIRLVCGRLDAVDEVEGLDSVDALAVGHYADVTPQAAEAALDEAISSVGAAAPPPLAERLLTRFTERGILRGRLGEPFFLPDPRAGQRVIALAGMGEPGRFGAPELTVLARELCWSLGRMGRKHLATVLIGAGTGNLEPASAIEAWIRGIKRALTGSVEGDAHRLAQITFVEEDPRKILELQEALEAAVTELREGDRLHITFSGVKDLDAIHEDARQRALEEVDRQWRQGTEGVDPHDRPPTRITLSMDPDGSYRFGAITESASVPERTVKIDAELVEGANQRLSEEGDLVKQVGYGDALRLLLFPADLSAQLSSPAPLVMLLDEKTARLHWEMAATAPAGALQIPGLAVESAQRVTEDELLDGFLGTGRGFTRQLRTRFAPPPEPPPPPRQVLRVLVVADPAEDQPLSGAREEGNAVAQLFERFNTVHADGPNRVEVVVLLGPLQASRIEVLTLLLQHTFDVLHFAGHCVYDQDDPQRSGWIFSGGERLATSELSRIDRVPKLVISNACESGVTADDALSASSDLAPSFAGAFFDRGVSNFVCTAWPVNDAAAREFALVLYGRLLALPDQEGGKAPAVAARMSEAMQDARRAVAGKPYGARTWGAYQHYGNPNFRFFERLREPDQSAAADSEA